MHGESTARGTQREESSTRKEEKRRGELEKSACEFALQCVPLPFLLRTGNGHSRSSQAAAAAARHFDRDFGCLTCCKVFSDSTMKGRIMEGKNRQKLLTKTSLKGGIFDCSLRPSEMQAQCALSDQ